MNSNMRDNVINLLTDLIEEEELNDCNDIVDLESQVCLDSIINTYNFNSRSIYLIDEICLNDVNDFFQVIKIYNYLDTGIEPKDRKPIKLYINTPGGDLEAVFSIIDFIEASETPIHTIILGNAYSGGFFIGISGHKRYCYPSSRLMFHQGMISEEGDCHKFIQRVDFYKEQMEKMKDIVLSKTKLSEQEYNKRMKDDWYIKPEEAVKLGMIDEILHTI